MSVWGTLLCSPLLILLEGEPADGSKRHYQVSSSKSSNKGLVLPSLNRSNWFVPVLTGIVAPFVAAAVYAIFLRGCGMSKFSLLFGSGDDVSPLYKKSRNVAGSLDEVALLAQKSIAHTLHGAARLNGSGIWTSNAFTGPVMHLLGLLMILPSLRYLIQYSWRGSSPPASKVTLLLPLSILSMLIGKGIPALVAAALISFVGGLMQLSSAKR